MGSCVVLELTCFDQMNSLFEQAASVRELATFASFQHANAFLSAQALGAPVDRP